MSIFEIKKEIEDLLDSCVTEDGEIDEESIAKLTELQEAKDEKLENTACWIVNMKAEANAIREQEKILAERRQKLERKIENVSAFLQEQLGGEKLANETRVCVSYRKTKSVEVDDGFIDWAMDNMKQEFLTFKDPTVNKTAIKDYLKDHELDNARIVESVSMSVK